MSKEKNNKEENKGLHIGVVSQQRELLVSFVKYIEEKTDMWRIPINEYEIDEYLETNCCESDSELLCECGGNNRVALDCTMKPCKHPKYYNK